MKDTIRAVRRYHAARLNAYVFRTSGLLMSRMAYLAGGAPVAAEMTAAMALTLAGVTMPPVAAAAALAAIIIDRLECFQSGPFSSPDNAAALTHFKEGLAFLQKRTRDRLARGVEGTNVK